MTPDLAELKRIAEAATPGPHEARFLAGGAPTDCCDFGIVSLSEGRETCRVWRREDAEFYVAAQASTVLALIARIEALEAGLSDAKFGLETTDACLRSWNGGHGGPANVEAILQHAANLLRDRHD